VTCGNGEGSGPGRRPVPGPGCGSRIPRRPPRDSAATASAAAGSSRLARNLAPMTLATELNPHKPELNPHEAVPGGQPHQGRSRRRRPRTGRGPPVRQLAAPEPAVTPPVIRRARDVPLPPLAGPAHVPADIAGSLVAGIAVGGHAETSDLDAARRTVSKIGRRPLLPMSGSWRSEYYALFRIPLPLAR